MLTAASPAIIPPHESMNSSLLLNISEGQGLAFAQRRGTCLFVPNPKTWRMHDSVMGSQVPGWKPYLLQWILHVISKTTQPRHTGACARCKCCERSEAISQGINLCKRAERLLPTGTLRSRREECPPRNTCTPRHLRPGQVSARCQCDRKVFLRQVLDGTYIVLPHANPGIETLIWSANDNFASWL